MFDKNKFAQILKNINETYDSQRDFSKKSEINRTYLSQYMNMKLNDPPKPKILEKLAISSHGITSYAELMKICGYIDISNYDEMKKNEFDKMKFQLYDRGFSQLQIDKISDYCTKKYIGQDSSFEKDMKEFESLLESLNIEDAKFILDFKATLTLNVANKYTEIANKIHSIVDKSNTLSDNYEYSDTPRYYMCPVYGQISAGQPNWAEECIEGRIPIDSNIMNIVNPEEHFFLRVNGESMNKIVRNGAYALIHKQDVVEDGEIAVVLVNGYNATLKKFSKQGDFVILEPMSDVTDDPDIKTQIYDKNTSIKILGKYIGKFEMNG